MVVRIDNSNAANHQIIKKKRTVQMPIGVMPQGEEQPELVSVNSPKEQQELSYGQPNLVYNQMQVYDPELMEKIRNSYQVAEGQEFNSRMAKQGLGLDEEQR